jgi:hypothetical protein
VRARFLATKDQLDAVRSEHELGCRLAIVKQGAPSPSRTVERLEELVLKVINYIASDSQQPRETLLKLSGTVEVRPVSETSYRSVFQYYLTRVPGSPAGNVEGLKIRPDFEGPAAALLPQFIKRYGDLHEAKEKEMIVLDVGDIRNPVLRYARYDFFDRNMVFVGAISFPIFLRSEHYGRDMGHLGAVVACCLDRWFSGR